MSTGGRDRFETDAIVVGAGVVGLACAATLAAAGHETLVLEQARVIGSGISSRNSEVVHAGIYYPTGSLKHLACVEGRRLLEAYAPAHGVALRRCGKLIVATTPAEVAGLAAIHAQAARNGVEEIELIDGARARELEPALSCEAALLSARTGIIDSHGYMLALQGELEDHGGSIAFGTPVERIEPLSGGGFEVWAGGESPAVVGCRLLVNSAGLDAHGVAARMVGYPAERLPPLRLAKGSYFGCSVRSPFRHLIYPAPADGGLGVHVTLDLDGRMRFGPDVEWLDGNDPAGVDYRVDPRRSESFYAAVRRYWPALPDGAITPDYSGCRPKLSARGEPAADFRIGGPAEHGIEGLVHLLGIESPGLTASLALAGRVRAALMA